MADDPGYRVGRSGIEGGLEVEVQMTWGIQLAQFLQHPLGAILFVTVFGFLLVWAFVLVFSRVGEFGATGVFAREIRGYRSWTVAFVFHALLVLLCASYFFWFMQETWPVMIPFLGIIVLDIILVGMHWSRAGRLAAISNC